MDNNKIMERTKDFISEQYAALGVAFSDDAVIKALNDNNVDLAAIPSSSVRMLIRLLKTKFSDRENQIVDDMLDQLNSITDDAQSTENIILLLALSLGDLICLSRVASIVNEEEALKKSKPEMEEKIVNDEETKTAKL